MVSLTRVLELDDAAELAAVWRENRAFLASSGPRREDEFFTEEGQLEVIGESLARCAAGHSLPLVVVEPSAAGRGAIVGAVTLSSIIRGAFQSASIGYWLAAGATGRGIMTQAVEEAAEWAFGELGLHRLQAEVMPANTASVRVLERTGFIQYGRAPDYLCIDGRWEEHLLFQRIASS
ncbi:GNAT family N-acetyltransferase [Aeromicrobium sp. CTD01-1L150]|uniref:GNAT family N-acetyltransferase n=1 Tax=Aeromicrobium sp. CTD01-1L150 TaxID=3341830 RepID=UPI0035BEBC1A